MGQERGNSVVNKDDFISPITLKTPGLREKSNQCTKCTMGLSSVEKW